MNGICAIVSTDLDPTDDLALFNGKLGHPAVRRALVGPEAVSPQARRRANTFRRPGSPESSVTASSKVILELWPSSSRVAT
jgi:hypothetical protein